MAKHNAQQPASQPPAHTVVSRTRTQKHIGGIFGLMEVFCNGSVGVSFYACMPNVGETDTLRKWDEYMVLSHTHTHTNTHLYVQRISFHCYIIRPFVYLLLLQLLLLLWLFIVLHFFIFIAEYTEYAAPHSRTIRSQYMCTLDTGNRVAASATPPPNARTTHTDTFITQFSVISNLKYGNGRCIYAHALRSKRRRRHRVQWIRFENGTPTIKCVKSLLLLLSLSLLLILACSIYLFVCSSVFFVRSFTADPPHLSFVLEKKYNRLYCCQSFGRNGFFSSSFGWQNVSAWIFLNEFIDLFWATDLNLWKINILFACIRIRCGEWRLKIVTKA